MELGKKGFGVRWQPMQRRIQLTRKQILRERFVVLSIAITFMVTDKNNIHGRLLRPECISALLRQLIAEVFKISAALPTKGGGQYFFL